MKHIAESPVHEQGFQMRLEVLTSCITSTLCVFIKVPCLSLTGLPQLTFKSHSCTRCKRHSERWSDSMLCMLRLTDTRGRRIRTACILEDMPWRLKHCYEAGCNSLLPSWLEHTCNLSKHALDLSLPVITVHQAVQGSLVNDCVSAAVLCCQLVTWYQYIVQQCLVQCAVWQAKRCHSCMTRSVT